MDDELERARRAAREAPDDLSAAVRLATVCERALRFAEAWTALVRLVGRSDDDSAVLAALGGLASRNPAAAVAYLRQVDEDRGRFSCLAMGRAGALLPLAVVACEPESPNTLERDAQIALRRALEPEIAGLPGVPFLRGFVQSDDARSWGIFPLISSMNPYPRVEIYRELGLLETGDDLDALPAIMFSAIASARADAPRRDLRGWTDFARSLVARARSERRHSLLPWLRAIVSARDASLAAEAVSAFRELSGRLAPPLDPDDLAVRWSR